MVRVGRDWFEMTEVLELWGWFGLLAVSLLKPNEGHAFNNESRNYKDNASIGNVVCWWRAGRRARLDA